MNTRPSEVLYRERIFPTQIRNTEVKDFSEDVMVVVVEEEVGFVG